MEKYNGWTNYATWRVNLEILDGYETNIESDPEEYAKFVNDGQISEEQQNEMIYQMMQELQSVVEEVMDSYDTESIVRSFADAFLEDVNYYEIAENKFLEIKNTIIELA